MSTSIAKMADTLREQEREIQRKDKALTKVRTEARVATKRMVGGSLALGAAFLSGALNGLLDVSQVDPDKPEGWQIFGIPVTPILGGGLGLLGLSDAVPGGYYIGNAGIGMGCEFLGRLGREVMAETKMAESFRERYLERASE